jgi:hypothetical protein
MYCKTAAAWVSLHVGFFAGFRMFCKILLMVLCVRPCTDVSFSSIALSYLSPVDGGDGEKAFYHSVFFQFPVALI